MRIEFRLSIPRLAVASVLLGLYLLLTGLAR